MTYDGWHRLFFFPIIIITYLTRNVVSFASRMSGLASPKREASPEKELIEIKKPKPAEITAELVETLSNEREKKEEQESDLDLTDSIADTLGSIGKVILELFQGEIKERNIPISAKIALKTLSKFVSVLTNTNFKNAKKKKIKNLQKIGTKTAFQTRQEQN